MPNTLSSDLASLKIDRDAKPQQGGPLRTILLWLVLIGAVAAGYVIGRPYLEARFFKTEVAISEIARVSPAQASIELSSSGYVVPQVRSQVGARIPGRVVKILVKEGMRVEAGQVLIELERADQQAAIQSAKMRAAAARARVHLSWFVLGEAVLLGLIGGVLAMAIGVPMINGGVGRFVEENFGGLFPFFRVFERDVVIAIALSGLLSVVAAGVPAYQAGKLQVTDALRKLG